jgi:hypothetical protein
MDCFKDNSVIQKIVRKHRLGDSSQEREDLAYWMSRPPAERLEAVEALRQRKHGRTDRLERIAHVVNAREVQYVVVGAHALAFYGVPRYTGDLDLFVRADEENAARILGALDEFGFGDPNLKVEDFAVEDNVIKLGRSPVRVDLMTSVTGVTWDEVDSGKQAGEIGRLPVSFIGRAELAKNKWSTGRLKTELTWKRREKK